MAAVIRIALAIGVLQLAGCSCGKPLSQYCKGDPCLAAPQLEAAMLTAAELRWLRGSCDGLEAGTCSAGGSWALASGFCFTRSIFDNEGALVFVETGCEGENKSYGFRRDCDATTTRDFCADARKRMVFKHLAMTFPAPMAVHVDDVPIETGATLAPGSHVLTFGGHSVEFEVIEEPVTLATQLKLITWSPALRLSENGRAGPVRMRDCVVEGLRLRGGDPWPRRRREPHLQVHLWAARWWTSPAQVRRGQPLLTQGSRFALIAGQRRRRHRRSRRELRRHRRRHGYRNHEGTEARVGHQHAEEANEVDAERRKSTGVNCRVGAPEAEGHFIR